MTLQRLDVINLIRAYAQEPYHRTYVAEDVVSPMTGEVIAEAGAVVDRELADAIQNAAVPYVWIAREESDRNIKVLLI